MQVSASETNQDSARYYQMRASIILIFKHKLIYALLNLGTLNSIHIVYFH